MRKSQLDADPPKVDPDDARLAIERLRELALGADDETVRFQAALLLLKLVDRKNKQ